MYCLSVFLFIRYVQLFTMLYALYLLISWIASLFQLMTLPWFKPLSSLTKITLTDHLPIFLCPDLFFSKMSSISLSVRSSRTAEMQVRFPGCGLPGAAHWLLDSAQAHRKAHGIWPLPHFPAVSPATPPAPGPSLMSRWLPLPERYGISCFCLIFCLPLMELSLLILSSK